MPTSTQTGFGSVASTDVLARSPIRPAAPVVARDGWEASARRSSAALTLTDVTAWAKVLVKADANGALTGSSLPFGRAVRTTGGGLEVGCGPGEWLHLGPPGSVARILVDREAGTAGDELVTVLDVTHGGALMRLTGRDAPSALAKLCAVNLSDGATPDLTAFRSSVAKTATDVVRDDVGGVRSYLLHCDRSVGQYLWDCVLDAGREFGIDVEGWAADERG
jgi:heterotetrameric sarcosine oxidase gamma subunit